MSVKFSMRKRSLISRKINAHGRDLREALLLPSACFCLDIAVADKLLIHPALILCVSVRACASLFVFTVLIVYKFVYVNVKMRFCFFRFLLDSRADWAFHIICFYRSSRPLLGGRAIASNSKFALPSNCKRKIEPNHENEKLILLKVLLFMQFDCYASVTLFLPSHAHLTTLVKTVSISKRSHNYRASNHAVDAVKRVE